MKMYRVRLTREMQITVNVAAETEEQAESNALGMAEAVGYVNVEPAVTVNLEREATLSDIEAF